MESIVRVLCATSAAAFILYVNGVFAQEDQRNLSKRSLPRVADTGTENELTRLRAEVIQKMKDARIGAQRLLDLHEVEEKNLTEKYERSRELYHQGLISRTDVIQAEHVLATAITRVNEDKQWLAETDMALTEASMRDELLRLPRLGVGNYNETGSLVRFNGATAWSLADAAKIKTFFLKAFGRGLPISAMGQTTTHDRLRFDHHDSMDVALHPDSKEGQSLLSYLRQAGIPFIGFRNAVPGAATGAHIHIGKPSPRT
jgi:hypothetical protein